MHQHPIMSTAAHEFRKKHISRWTVSNVSQWLRVVALHDLSLSVIQKNSIIQCFEEQMIDGDVLLELNQELLEKNLNVKWLGIRCKILKQIAQWTDESVLDITQTAQSTNKVVTISLESSGVDGTTSESDFIANVDSTTSRHVVTPAVLPPPLEPAQTTFGKPSTLCESAKSPVYNIGHGYVQSARILPDTKTQIPSPVDTANALVDISFLSLNPNFAVEMVRGMEKDLVWGSKDSRCFYLDSANRMNIFVNQHSVKMQQWEKSLRRTIDLAAPRDHLKWKSFETNNNGAQHKVAVLFDYDGESKSNCWFFGSKHDEVRCRPFWCLRSYSIHFLWYRICCTKKLRWSGS